MMMKRRKILSFIFAIALAVSIFAGYVPVTRAEVTIDQVGTVNTPDTNLRAQPSALSDVLVRMDKGAAVSVLEGSTGGWYKVMYQGYTGYVRTDFIDVMVTGLNDPGVIVSEAAMTSEAGGGAAMGTLAVETQVTITGSYGSYYQVKTQQDMTGFVPMDCVHKKKIITLNMSATINASNVNLRSIPSTSGEIVACMKRGDKVMVHSLQDHWVKVDYQGKSGYVRGDFVTYDIPGENYLTAMNVGMRGPAVSTLQVALRKKGFFHVAANGVYGKATRAAVKKFQQSVYLDADGVAGEQTLLLLFGKDAAKIWNNFRSELEPQEPQQNGRVWLIDWFDGMNKIMKRMTPFLVIDVRTGISWKMQRFGGYTALWHADVETVTKKDTEKMTEAWGGELNPTRRPVWVKYDGKYYAASLMGYVHNTGPTPNNGMDGQVCLHFRGSKIHSSGRLDEAHQACIMEAYYNADKLDAYISSGKV
jgi:uncharacterized protein YgiM (DUF1202 family)